MCVPRKRTTRSHNIVHQRKYGTGSSVIENPAEASRRIERVDQIQSAGARMWLTLPYSYPNPHPYGMQLKEIQESRAELLCYFYSVH